MPLDYVRQPDAIYEKSFQMISRVKQLQAMPLPIQPLATRIVHACGMPEILDELRYSADLIDVAGVALENGADIYCDVETLRHGIMGHLLPPECKLHCRISAPEVHEYSRQHKMTRAAAQFDLWGERVEGQIVAIGNAPTALFRLLENIDAGGVKPAAIIAFPVGFVGAAESKSELAGNSRGVSYVTLLGKKGGTAMAQAAVNAIAGGLSV